MTKLTKAQIDRAKIIRGELTKVRCWLTGFHAGRGSAALLSGIPGEDGVRQAIMLLDELAPGRAALSEHQQ